MAGTGVYRRRPHPARRRVAVFGPTPAAPSVAVPLDFAWLKKSAAWRRHARPEFRPVPRQERLQAFGAAAAPPAPATVGEAVLAMVARPYDPDIEVAEEGPPFTLMQASPAGDRAFAYTGAERPVFASDIGYISHGADTPAHSWFAPILKRPFNFGVKLWEGERPGQRSKPGAGLAELDNSSGDLDDALDLGWDGRAVEFYTGLRPNRFSTFALVYRGPSSGLAGWNENTVKVGLRDQQGVFDKPIQARFYPGGGGVDGSDAVKGKPWPIVLGAAPNIAPTMVDDTLLLLQLSDRPLTGTVAAVRDKGSALVASSTPTYATVEALIAALTGLMVDAGTYALTADGMYMGLGSEPAGQITVDIADTATTGALIRDVVATRLGSDGFTDPAGLDTAAFTAIDVAQPAAVGLFLSSEESPSAGDVVDMLLGGIGAWGMVEFTGRFTLAVLEAPAGDADDVLTDADLYADQPIEKTTVIPPAAFRVGYRRMWTVQPADSLAGIADVSPAERQLYSIQYRYERAASITIGTKHKFSLPVDVAGLFVDQADALAEANRLRALHMPERGFYKVRVARTPFERRAGSIVEVSGIARFGFAGSKKFVLHGIDADLSTGRTYWTLWG